MARKASHDNPRAATAERTLELTGTTIRLLLEPLADGQVRILEYYRRRKNDSRSVRIKDEEGVKVQFELLRLEQSFDELFPQADMFPGDGKGTASSK